jgi:hypothetical protein
MVNARQFEDGIRNVRGNYNDFRAYYALGRIADSPDKANMMQREVQRDWYCRVSTPAGADCSDYSPIPYLPFFSLAWMPLAKLPINVSYVAWSVIGVIGFYLSVCALGFSRIPKSTVFAPILIAACALGSVPALRCLVLGQSAFVITALVALYYVCWIRRWDVTAGVIMALTTFKPQFLIYTLIPPVVKKRGVILLSFVITEVLLCGATIAVLGVKPLLECFTATAKLGSTNWDQIWTMLSIISLYFYASHTVMMILWAITFGAGVVLLGWLWKRGSDTNWLIAATVCTSLLISYSQLYDAILLAVPAVITLGAAGARNVFKPDWRERLWWAILYVYPVCSWIVWAVFGRFSHMSYHWFTLVLMAQAALAISLALRPPAASPDAPVVAESPQQP